MQQTHIAALEIGSSHIRLAVASVTPDGAMTLLAKEDESVNDSTSFGWIKNIDDIASRVNSLVRKIENYPSVSPRKIHGVYMSLGGRSMMANPVKVIRQFDDEIELDEQLINQMKEEARTSTLSERKVLEVSPRAFVIDNQATQRPLGVLGRQIEAEFNVISARNHGSINLNRIDTLAQRQNLSVKGKFVRQTALANLVLTPDELDLGCMLVDFGAETVAVSIYRGGAMRYYTTLPIGSRIITRDLMTLNQVEDRAEFLKKTIGDAGNLTPQVDRPDIDCNPTEINNYVFHRAAEIAVNIVEQAKYAGLTFSDLPKGIVLVGGGSNLRGFAEALNRLSHTPVRFGAIPSSIRVADNSVPTLEMLDVIATLKMAADNNPQECTEIPEHLNTSAQTAQIDNNEYVDPVPDDEDGPGPEPRKGRGSKKPKTEVPDKPKGPSLASKFMNRLSAFFDEPEDQKN